MMRKTIFLGAALLGFAIPAAAQVHIHGSLGRHIRVHADIGHSHHYPAPRPVHTGHWHTVNEQVYVPGCFREEHLPPRYGWVIDSCGHRHWDVIEPGGCRRVWVPPHYETRSRQVWVGC